MKDKEAHDNGQLRILACLAGLWANKTGYERRKVEKQIKNLANTLI